MQKRRSSLRERGHRRPFRSSSFFVVVCLRVIARGVNGMGARKGIMRLTGWQRVGILLSVVWALGAGIYMRNADVERADNFAKFAYLRRRLRWPPDDN